MGGGGSEGAPSGLRIAIQDNDQANRESGGTIRRATQNTHVRKRGAFTCEWMGDRAVEEQ